MTETKTEISVIIVASEGRESVAHLFTHLMSQKAADRLEVLVSAQAQYVEDLQDFPDHPFGAYHVVPADFSTSARARTDAIRAATTPLVVFAEDHCFPVGDQWAERIIAAHDGPFTAVGPIMENANPDTLTSWANLFVEYGPWLSHATPGEKENLPGHNSSYKRASLMEYGDGLAAMLEVEWVMQADMRAKGHRFLLADGVRARHLNFSRLSSSIRLQFFGGWMFAASRSAGWPASRRAFFCLAWPAIVFLRIVRTWPIMKHSQLSSRRRLACLPVTAFLFLCSGVGEALGYALGDCDQRNKYALLEYRRWTNLVDDERTYAR
ncbi:hypothetical protein KX928_14070 [Roseobacter sp. YSTF-M11]|uniref:Glycosyltransferase 2-like domain-containing protein n=1 Tax=Roseobacter insulae TaxID=2859783 RepID=A0A9X1FWL3_9RHOB|nr:hypothetical protein [Roseobacter insulae]MBW4708911.1 hypothetical protein [Roseobacter insulae]